MNGHFTPVIMMDEESQLPYLLCYMTLENQVPDHVTFTSHSQFTTVIELIISLLTSYTVERGSLWFLLYKREIVTIFHSRVIRTYIRCRTSYPRTKYPTTPIVRLTLESHPLRLLTFPGPWGWGSLIPTVV